MKVKGSFYFKKNYEFEMCILEVWNSQLQNYRKICKNDLFNPEKYLKQIK